MWSKLVDAVYFDLHCSNSSLNLTKLVKYGQNLLNMVKIGQNLIPMEVFGKTEDAEWWLADALDDPWESGNFSSSTRTDPKGLKKKMVKKWSKMAKIGQKLVKISTWKPFVPFPQKVFGVFCIGRISVWLSTIQQQLIVKQENI